MCTVGWPVWCLWWSNGADLFRLDLEYLLLGPGVLNEGSILFMPEIFSISFDADLIAWSFERILVRCEVSGLINPAGK
jgi:hypothetical protein